MRDDLPLGWTRVSPDDVAAAEKHSLAIGPFGSNLKVSDYRTAGTAGVPLVFVRHIRSARFDDEGPFVSAEKAVELSAHAVRPGDVLITKMGEPPGDATMYPQGRPPGIITADCIKWSIDSQIGVARFFEYTLHALDVKRQIAGIAQGVAQRKVSLERFRGIKMPCAPLNEQARVVEALDSLCSRLDAAVATLEAAQAKLRAYRASVLKAAVEGRLVPTEAALVRAEKRDFEPADVLLKRILSERRGRWEEAELAKLKAAGKAPRDDRWKARYEEPKDPETVGLPKLPEGWCWASVGALSEVSGGLTKNAARDQHARRLPYLRVANVYANELKLDEIKEIGVSDDELPRVTLRTGDLLIVEGNGSVDQIGRVALWDGAISLMVHQNHLIKARFGRAPLERWALTWLLSPGGRGAIVRVASSTSGLHTLSISKVENLPIPLPPLAEQGRILDEVDAATSIVAATAATIAGDCRRCVRLRQAVLKWAFEGKLADQDPNDEPAEKLLERIRAERAAAIPARRTRRRNATAST